MTHHPVFEKYSRVPTETTGAHIFDFLGSATRVAYKRGWSRHAQMKGQTVTPGLPGKDEHYLDWIALLTAVDRAQGTFRMAELGAGWAPWLVRGALATGQRREITALELLAVEADPTHYEWIGEHFLDNGLDPKAHNILHGAVAGSAGMLRFPVIDEPDVDYGAGLAAASRAERTIEVTGYTLTDLLNRFTGPVDFLHVDIQGAEYDCLPPAMPLLRDRVKSIMVGTHQSDDRHEGLREEFHAQGWNELLALGRNQTHTLAWGEIATNDGFLWFENPLR